MISLPQKHGNILNRYLSVGLLVLALMAAHGMASELRVDLNVPESRSGVFSGHRVNWSVPGGHSEARTFGNVQISFRADGTNALRSVWYKGLLDYDAPMAADGITTSEKSGNGTIEMVLSGLAPGTHSLATFHNEVRNVDPTRFDIEIGNDAVATGVLPTQRATNDYEVAAVWFEFDAEAGKDVVIRFVPAASGKGEGIVINGFELDSPDPNHRAKEPFPANDDEHAPQQPELRWSAPATADSHELYFGTDSNAVACATPSSPECQARLSHSSYPSHSLPQLDSRLDYFWRVDELDAQNNATRGDVWRFRVRHLAFPSAEGYGRFARGGRGGRVIKVTNLNNKGPGSLRAAVEAEGPRTVVFDVSGLITLESRLIIRNPYLTIAGQTAPGKGICIRKYNLGMLGARDVIIRDIRVRPGNISGTTLDGMGMAGSDNCIIDHCSISWTIDEAFSSRSARNITLQRTLISEALNDAGHKNYPPGTQHGYAASIGGNIGSFHHNLLADCCGRNWSLAGGLDNRGFYAGRLDIRNNVVYNWRKRATDGGAHEVNFVANYYKPGPSTERFHALKAQYGGFPGKQQYYFVGNVMPGHFGLTNQTDGRIATTERGGHLPTDYSPWVNEPFFDPHVQTHSAQEAYTNVLANVGCNVPALDEHDKRIIGEVRNGTVNYRGSKTDLPGLPDSQEDVGGWEDYPEIHRPADWDSDDDGMPNDWEQRCGLNPNDASDAQADRNGDGYTNLEEYLGSLTGDFPAPSTQQ